MENLTARLFAAALLVICLFTMTASAQVRRRPARSAVPRRRSAPLLVPLTAEQKEEVAGLIENAEDVDYDYKFSRSQYLMVKAGEVAEQADRVAESLPEGNLQKLVLAMGLAYHDASILYCTYTNNGYCPQEIVMRVIERNGFQNLRPYEMVVRTFGAASILKNDLNAALAKSPTAEVRSKPSAQPDAEAGWAFPTEGMRGEYNADIGGMVYDLGNGIFAAHTTIVTGSPIVMVVFSKAYPTEKIKDFDLAITIAYKVVKLPEKMADTVLGQNKIGEYLFRTASGKTIGVSIPPDRETAIVRLLEDGEEK